MLLYPFALIGGVAVVFNALTQETRSRFPMKGKRAVCFSASAALLISGAFIGFSLLFWNLGLSAMMLRDVIDFKVERLAELSVYFIALILALILPGVALLVYLILTQETRLKPWVRDYVEKQAARFEVSERFGLMCAFIWTLAVALYVVLGFIFGWLISLSVFLFAVAAQMLALYKATP